MSTLPRDNWLSRVGNHRLAAVFLGDDLPDEDFYRLIRDVGELDPNVPIVLIDRSADA